MRTLKVSQDAHRMRHAIVEVARELIAHDSDIDYVQARPIPYHVIRKAKTGLYLDYSPRWKIDCSGSSILCVRAAALRVLEAEDLHKIFALRGTYDDGYGWTGSLGPDLPHISAEEVRPGDFALFPGHVTVMLQRVYRADKKKPQVAFHRHDPMVESMGGNDDPSKMHLSVFGSNVTFLKTVPDNL
jgi:hypothetical protein